MKNSITVQEWIKINQIVERGIVKLKNNRFIKIIKIFPINYSLKSEIEKEAILNSYKIFLKTCNFNFQILIQSNKENLEQIISKINNQKEKENNKKIIEITENYIKYIKDMNYKRKSAAKIFYIIIESNQKNKENLKDVLNEKYLKIKENLERCGNYVEEINSIGETRTILYSFYNKRLQEKNI